MARRRGNGAWEERDGVAAALTFATPTDRTQESAEYSSRGQDMDHRRRREAPVESRRHRVGGGEEGEWELTNFSYESLLELGSMAVKRKGVSAKAMAALPKHTHELSDNKGEEGCCICMEDFEKGETVVALPCSHSFHFDCAKEWLQLNESCPVCRKEIQS